MGITGKKHSTNDKRHPYMTLPFWERRLQDPTISFAMQERIKLIIADFRPQPNYLP